MARERSPNRDKAFEIYKESNGKTLLKDIAIKLNVSDSQIRKWKNQDKWDDKLKGNVTIKSKGNVTNDGNTKKVKKVNKKATRNFDKESYPLLARPGNKNAVKTGEFETIFFDSLDDDEINLIEQTPFEKMELLKQEIQLLTVRERRMLKRIADLKNEEMVLDTKTEGLQGKSYMKVSNFESTLNKIQNIEDSLTRVQEKKQRAIDSLHKYEMDERKHELEVKKITPDTDGSSEGIQDFINATSISEDEVKELFKGDEDGQEETD